MKKLAFLVTAALIFLIALPAAVTLAQDVPPDYYDTSAQSLLSADELSDLLAPIALYPDPLIAQILPAATFVDQVDEAARYVRQYGTAGIDSQPWDISVRSIAHYPDVLNMMDQKYEWTVALGQAYIEQPQDVMDAIQRLRAQADAEGNLYSTPQQQVVVQQDVISIVPASPEYVYVPVYDPYAVYYEPYYPGYPFITFSTGFVIGAWLNRDCDWHRHRVYYHGWRGGGWVGRARPHIHDRRGVYIGSRAAPIHVNNRIMTRDTRQYREQLRTQTWKHREGRPVPQISHSPQTAPAAPRRGEQRPRQGHPAAGGGRPAPAAGTRGGPGAGSRQAPATTGTAPAGAPVVRERPAGGGRRHAPGTTSGIPAPSAPATRTTPAPTGTVTAPAAPRATSHGTGTGDVYRGRDIQRTQPASQSGYGGYGTGRDATIYRERGQSSRETIRQPRPMQRPRSYTPPSSVGAPASRPAATPRPAPTPSAQPMQRAPSAPSAPRSFAPVPRSMPSAPAPRAVSPAPRPSMPSAAPRAVAPAPRPSMPSAAPGGPVMPRGGPMMPRR